MSAVLSDVLWSALQESGLVKDPDRVRRVVIDLQAGEPPVIHIEKYGDDRLLSVIRALGGVEITREELP